MVRYTVTNKSSSPREIELALQFGETRADLSCKAIPGPYPRKLSFAFPFIRQDDGAYLACVLSGDANSFSFRPIAGPQSPSAQSLTLNGSEVNITSPEYAVEVERQGDKVSVGQWHSPTGVDFYVESSRIHSSPLAVNVEVVGPDNVVKPVGKLSRTGFSASNRPIGDYIQPGQHSAVLPWAKLAKSLPQGVSKIVVRCYHPSNGRRELVSSWSPIVVLTRSNATPRFKNAELMPRDGNRLTTKQTLAPGESRSVDLAVPYFPLPEQSGRQLAALQIDDELGKFREFWSRELNRGAEFIVPEKRIRDAYRACVASNFILIDRDPTTGLLMPHPDPLGYEAVWAGDGSVSIQATDRMGYHKEAESMLDYFLARQGKDKPEGDVQSAEGFFSGDVDLKWMNQNGFVLWAMADHYKLTHDEAWLRRVAPQLVKGCDWIIRERANEGHGERQEGKALRPAAQGTAIRSIYLGQLVLD